MQAHVHYHSSNLTLSSSYFCWYMFSNNSVNIMTTQKKSRVEDDMTPNQHEMYQGNYWDQFQTLLFVKVQDDNMWQELNWENLGSTSPWNLDIYHPFSPYQWYLPDIFVQYNTITFSNTQSLKCPFFQRRQKSSVSSFHREKHNFTL